MKADPEFVANLLSQTGELYDADLEKCRWGLRATPARSGARRAPRPLRIQAPRARPSLRLLAARAPQQGYCSHACHRRPIGIATCALAGLAGQRASGPHGSLPSSQAARVLGNGPHLRGSEGESLEAEARSA